MGSCLLIENSNLNKTIDNWYIFMMFMEFNYSLGYIYFDALVLDSNRSLIIVLDMSIIYVVVYLFLLPPTIFIGLLVLSSFVTRIVMLILSYTQLGVLLVLGISFILSNYLAGYGVGGVPLDCGPLYLFFFLFFIIMLGMLVHSIHKFVHVLRARFRQISGTVYVGEIISARYFIFISNQHNNRVLAILVIWVLCAIYCVYNVLWYSIELESLATIKSSMYIDTYYVVNLYDISWNIDQQVYMFGCCYFVRIKKCGSYVKNCVSIVLGVCVHVLKHMCGYYFISALGSKKDIMYYVLVFCVLWRVSILCTCYGHYVWVLLPYIL